MKCCFIAQLILTLILLALTISLNVLLITKFDSDEAKQGSVQNAVREGRIFVTFSVENCLSIEYLKLFLNLRRLFIEYTSLSIRLSEKQHNILFLSTVETWLTCTDRCPSQTNPLLSSVKRITYLQTCVFNFRALNLNFIRSP